MSNDNNDIGYKIVVVGSSKFEDQAFVFGVLDALKANYLAENNRIEKVYSSDYTGVSKFAKEWAILNGIEYQPHHFFSTDKTNPFFENADLPPAVIQNDKYYQEGKDFLISQGINIVLTMPNKEGQLGVQTANIMRMAETAGIGVYNAQDLYKTILKIRDEERNIHTNTNQKEIPGVKNLGSLGKI